LKALVFEVFSAASEVTALLFTCASRSSEESPTQPQVGALTSASTFARQVIQEISGFPYLNFIGHGAPDIPFPLGTKPRLS